MRITILTSILVFISNSNSTAKFKAEKDISYGPDERNVMDVYWNTKFKDAPIVLQFTEGVSKTVVRHIVIET